eukprot:10110867-Karenia_brevis.AAC.1
MATFYEENAHVVPNATYIVEGMPPHFSPEDMVKTFGKWTSEPYPNGWQIIPQGNPFISKGVAKWKVIAAQDPPAFFQHAENGAILITKLDPTFGHSKRLN